MAEEIKNATPDTGKVDEEVADWVEHGVAMLCDAADEDVKVKFVRGDRSVTFLVDLKQPRYRSMLVGKKGHTIIAFRQLLQSIGGAYGRHYDINLADDKPPARREPTTPRP
jgi:predicted RNA-binding protein YlqC (UPF0109 family)